MELPSPATTAAVWPSVPGWAGREIMNAGGLSAFSLCISLKTTNYELRPCCLEGVFITMKELGDRAMTTAAAAAALPQRRSSPPKFRLLSRSLISPFKQTSSVRFVPPVSQCLPALLPLRPSTLSVIPLSKVWMSIGRKVWAFLSLKKKGIPLCVRLKERERISLLLQTAAGGGWVHKYHLQPRAI